MKNRINPKAQMKKIVNRNVYSHLNKNMNVRDFKIIENKIKTSFLVKLPKTLID